MLQRSIAQPLRRSPTLLKTCPTCTCSCGRTFLPNALPQQQNRHKSRLRVSPGVARRRSDRETRALSPAEKKYQQELQAFNSTRHYDWFNRMHKSGEVSFDASTGIDFLNAFAALATNGPVYRSGAQVDVAAFRALLSEHGIGEGHAMRIGRGLLQDDDDDNRNLGKRIVYTLSSIDYEDATMWILRQVLAQSGKRPNVLRSTETAGAREKLRAIAERGDNYRAMVLEGKLANAMGQTEYAMKLWRRAMDSAVAHSERATLLKMRGRRDETENLMSGESFDDLSAPWIEVHRLALKQGDMHTLKWAIDIGCKMDDPISHYSAAAIGERRENATSKWLYHMTKSAASGYVKAAHELGLFYSESGWKYIEDEPPDHIKPTPFDSYPPTLGRKVGKTLPYWWKQARLALGLQQEQPDPTESMFHTATFPSTPYDRFRMALQWFQVGMDLNYVPSYHAAAKLLLQEELWAQTAAPKEALELSDERYSFASREEYELAKSENRLDEPVTDEMVPNPGYNPERAKDLIREIFYAKMAEDKAREYSNKFNVRRRTGAEERKPDLEEWLQEDNLDAEGKLDKKVTKWFRFPEIRDMYVDYQRGVLFDDVWSPGVSTNLVKEAEDVCNTQGWDIWAHDDGGLIYSHQPSRTGR